jgi:hypothetical protein
LMPASASYARCLGGAEMLSHATRPSINPKGATRAMIG